jgi:hypothetical protein
MTEGYWQLESAEYGTLRIFDEVSADAAIALLKQHVKKMGWKISPKATEPMKG